jgi:hypothetical protein
MRSIWVLGAFLTCASVCCAEAPRSEPVWAVWKEQHVRFAYLGRTSRYSCEGLRERVRALLLDLGARRDMRVVSVGCDPSGQAAGSAAASKLDVAFFSLGLREAKLSASDVAASVASAYEPFAITIDPFRNIGVADCELIEEFALQMLPKFATRNLQEKIACELPQGGAGAFVVRGEILRNSPAP